MPETTKSIFKSSSAFGIKARLDSVWYVWWFDVNWRGLVGGVCVYFKGEATHCTCPLPPEWHGWRHLNSHRMPFSRWHRPHPVCCQHSTVGLLHVSRCLMLDRPNFLTKLDQTRSSSTNCLIRVIGLQGVLPDRYSTMHDPTPQRDRSVHDFNPTIIPIYIRSSRSPRD